MNRLKPAIASFCLLSGFAWGQTEAKEPTVGYLSIAADADHVEIFLDGRSLGLTPIEEELVLIPGWYHISFFGPEFKWSHWTHRQRKTIVNVIEAGTHHVLVRPGERTHLQMEWLELERQLAIYEDGTAFTVLVGLAMISSAFLLLATVTL